VNSTTRKNLSRRKRRIEKRLDGLKGTGRTKGDVALFEDSTVPRNGDAARFGMILISGRSGTRIRANPNFFMAVACLPLLLNDAMANSMDAMQRLLMDSQRRCMS
jgi:hypothetical protein